MPVKRPDRQMWIAFNHIPNGQIVVQHFEDIVREKKAGDDQVKRVKFSCETQIEGFRHSDFVGLYENGKIVKNKVLIFPRDRDIIGAPNAANVVIEWAIKEMGMMPVPAPEKPAQKMEIVGNSGGTVTHDVRAEEMQKTIDQLKAENEAIQEKLNTLIKLVENPNKGEEPENA